MTLDDPARLLPLPVDLLSGFVFRFHGEAQDVTADTPC
jgi:hypothetical protein